MDEPRKSRGLSGAYGSKFPNLTKRAFGSSENLIKVVRVRRFVRKYSRQCALPVVLGSCGHGPYLRTRPWKVKVQLGGITRLPLPHPLRQLLPHHKSPFKIGLRVLFDLRLKHGQTRGKEHTLPQVKPAEEPGAGHLPTFRHQ